MLKWPLRVALPAALLLLPACFLPAPERFQPAFAAKSFVNWESPHVTPLALSSDGARLYAVNTPAARVEVFDTSGEAPVWVAAIPVGLDPVSARLRDDGELWVVNHISDSVSIVDLERGLVTRTLRTDDEPTDVAFAGDKAFVVCSQVNCVYVYDVADLDATPTRIDIMGEDPRALAVSPDGGSVYVTVFESGNHTTLLPWEEVSDFRGPYGGQNPPPNDGARFDPPIKVTFPPPPPVSLIVRKDANGAWLDDNGVDWSDRITWDLHDHDLAIVDAETLAVRYVRALMTTNMHLAVRPDGRVLVVGTEAANEVRFEPRITGRFVRSVSAEVDPADAAVTARRDLNPQLADAYAQQLSRVEAGLRSRSLADPRGVAFGADGAYFVAGMGSNNVAAFDADGARRGELAVAEGPTGLAFDAERGRLFVLNRFDASVSQVDPVALSETARTAFFDPTPTAIKEGRPFLYDAHLTSGLGVTACGACHVDGRTDQLAWDLGDPSGALKPFNQQCNHPFFGIPYGDCEDWHPMKGPMTTQTLQGAVGTEPFHWRGDREDLAAFNPAFVGLLGREHELTADEMAKFEAFIATIRFPPNPNRNLDHSLKAQVGDGRPPIGEDIFFEGTIDLGIVNCNECHNTLTGGLGTNHKITPRLILIIPHQSIDVPQIRNMYEKAGFSKTSLENNLGFGHNHDGNVDGLVNFFHIPNFTGFAPGPAGEQERLDLISYVMSLGSDTHAGVGTQVTLGGAGTNARADGIAGALPAALAADGGAPDTAALTAAMMLVAGRGEADLVVQATVDGARRGLRYDADGLFVGLDEADAVTPAALLDTATADAPQTWTLVPRGTAREYLGYAGD